MACNSGRVRKRQKNTSRVHAHARRSTRISLTFVDATDIACHTKIRQAHDFGCMQ
jgi:hypothetical protein